MSYELIYDITRERTGGLIFAALASASLICAVVCRVWRRRMGQILIGSVSVPRGDLGVAMGATFGFFLAITFINICVEYRRLCAALITGQAQVVEGPVEELTETGDGHHHRARFVVKGTTFWVLEGGENGYARVPSRGSPLHEGLPVRIHFVGRQIVRLDVATP